ncbi:hypothetical protein P171DRAFT_210355 [Karstenula rhodostoma CBS 690.94]|uniref:Uncharacterized protein n=1 Tax=Karstenula rhodostoma CBS 690.94 TaxID=1392251 RepID=A0A9P4PND5_9PLEO|nr:hypothetical protein P171DRAFT_210355 [Karstenula rhodostoma CBS 690.94]
METMKNAIQRLEREMTDLRLKIHKQEVDLKVIWAGRQGKSLKLYSKVHLQYWSGALYDTLPRELRDTIYSLCLDHDWTDQAFIESLSVLYGFSRPQSWDHNQLRKYVLLDPSFVRKEVAVEVAEMMYARARVPSFGMNRCEGKPRVLHMSQFLKRDFFGLGVPPASHIRRLELKLLKNRLSTRNQDALRDNFKSLLLCRHNRSLRIDVVFPQGNSAFDVLFFLHLLYSTYTALVSRKITFDFIYQRRLHESNPPDADKDETQPLNLTHMFELPQGMWKNHLKALCECVGKLSAREQRWRGYRTLEKEDRDVWADMEGETLAILDQRGRDAWALDPHASDVWPGETGCKPCWGECWNWEHWNGGNCEGLHEEVEK